MAWKCPRCGFEGLIYEKKRPGPKESNEHERVRKLVEEHKRISLAEISRRVRSVNIRIADVIRQLEYEGVIKKSFEPGKLKGRPRMWIELTAEGDWPQVIDKKTGELVRVKP